MLQVLYEKCLADDAFLHDVISCQDINENYLDDDVETALEELDEVRKNIAAFFSYDDIENFINRMESDDVFKSHALEYSRESIAFILSRQLTGGLASVVWVS
jgi:hypothetical protein